MLNFSDVNDNRDLNLKKEIQSRFAISEQIKFTVGYLKFSGFYKGEVMKAKSR